MQQKIKAFIMNLFCMEGSWKWAKKKMLAGYMIRSTEWVGPLKFRAHPVTKVFEIDFSNQELQQRWVAAAINLSQDLYTQVTSYEVFKWHKPYKVITYSRLEFCNN